MSALPLTTDSRFVARIDSTCLLSDHFEKCVHDSGRLHRLYCGLEAFIDFVAPRLVTTLVLVTGVVVSGMWLLSR